MVMHQPLASNADVIYQNRDLSTGDLSQWTHRDWGLGTDVGSNNSGAGVFWYHSNVGGRRAAGVTITPTAHASNSANSDAVYLWDPTAFWNYQPYEFWVRASVMFPSAATISASGMSGEQPFQPTTGSWNWLMQMHNDGSAKPSCNQEYPNISLDVRTDDTVQSGVVGTKNVRMSARVTGGNDCSPNTVWIDAPPLQYDHWYEMLFHIKLDPTAGVFEWYLDNFTTPYYSNLNVPTLFTRPAGYVSPSYVNPMEQTNYRYHATWNSTVYFGPMVTGSTKSSVLNAF